MSQQNCRSKTSYSSQFRKAGASQNIKTRTSWFCFNLIVAAIILWHTRYLASAFAELGRRGDDVSPELIRHLAPLGWQHIALTVPRCRGTDLG
ncbi:MAG: Tn3 family transposase [Methylocella sp.]